MDSLSEALKDPTTMLYKLFYDVLKDDKKIAELSKATEGICRYFWDSYQPCYCMNDE